MWLIHCFTFLRVVRWLIYPYKQKKFKWRSRFFLYFYHGFFITIKLTYEQFGHLKYKKMVDMYIAHVSSWVISLLFGRHVRCHLEAKWWFQERCLNRVGDLFIHRWLLWSMNLFFGIDNFSFFFSTSLPSLISTSDS